MRQSRFSFVPELQQTLAERPTCTCGMQMWLSRLMPASKPGQELRVFECPVCERTEYTTVELENYRLKTRRSPDLAAETSPCVGGGKGLIPTYPIALALLGHGL
jgi:hypothetical protein